VLLKRGFLKKGLLNSAATSVADRCRRNGLIFSEEFSPIFRVPFRDFDTLPQRVAICVAFFLCPAVT